MIGPPDASLADTIVVIICALNEAETVASVIQGVPTTIDGRGALVLLVDDGSTDGTGEIGTRAGATVICHDRNLGHGRSIRDGIAWAAARDVPVVVLMDADGQHDPAEIPAIARPVLRGDADLAVGSRVLGRSEETTTSLRLGIRVFSVLFRLLFGVRLTDSSNGFRALRVSSARAMDLRSDWDALAEMNVAAALHRLRIVEVPVTIYARRHGSSKMGGALRMGIQYFPEMARAYRSQRRLARQRRSGHAVELQPTESEVPHGQ